MRIHTTVGRRPSWRGIFAGLLMGLVVSMAIFGIGIGTWLIFIIRS